MTDHTDLIARLQHVARSHGVEQFGHAHAVLEAATVIAQLSAEVERLREGIAKVRDGYASQMKFCDIEALGYFREFLHRIDAALKDASDAP